MLSAEPVSTIKRLAMFTLTFMVAFTFPYTIYLWRSEGRQTYLAANNVSIKSIDSYVTFLPELRHLLIENATFMDLASGFMLLSAFLSDGRLLRAEGELMLMPLLEYVRNGDCA